MVGAACFWGADASSTIAWVGVSGAFWPACPLMAAAASWMFEVAPNTQIGVGRPKVKWQWAVKADGNSYACAARITWSEHVYDNLHEATIIQQQHLRAGIAKWPTSKIEQNLQR